MKICTFWCQGPVKVPRPDRRCFWTRKTNGLRQPQMLEFRDFSVPAALFLRFCEKWTSLSKKCIKIPSFGPARPQRAKHCITNAFLYTFRGVWRHRADFHKNAFFRKIGIPIGLLCFYEILNLAMYFLFLLKSVTRTNTYNPQGISMIWRQVDTEFPKNHENIRIS